MPAWLSWIISLLRAFMGIRANIHDKEQQDIGGTKQVNADLTEELKEKTHEAQVMAAPDRAESAVLGDLYKHAGD